jgi:hypothetical protein
MELRADFLKFTTGFRYFGIEIATGKSESCRSMILFQTPLYEGANTQDVRFVNGSGLASPRTAARIENAGELSR